MGKAKTKRLRDDRGLPRSKTAEDRRMDACSSLCQNIGQETKTTKKNGQLGGSL